MKYKNTRPQDETPPYENEIRLKPKARKILEVASTLPLKKALKMIATLVGTVVEEVYREKRYSARTDKPTEYAWKPREIWDGKLGITGEHGIWLDPDSPMFKKIKKKFPEGTKTLVGKVIVVHYPLKGEGIGERYLSFQKIHSITD